MDISVGDLAQLYGLSSQTLHFYEDKGILSPTRDVLNKYRSYQLTDLQKIGTIKKLRNAQMSLNDSVYICTDATELDIVECYTRQKRLLMAEIEEKLKILRQLELDLGLYMRLKIGGYAFREEKLDAFHRFESPKTEIIFQDRSLRKEATPWFKNILHTSASEMFYIDGSEDGFSRFTYGMIATEKNAYDLQLPISTHVTTIPKGLFITTVMDTKNDMDLKKVIIDGRHYLAKNGYVLRQNPFSYTVFVYQENNHKYSIKYMIFPVKKNGY